MPNIDLIDAADVDSRMLAVIRSAPLPELDGSAQCSSTSRAIKELMETLAGLQPSVLAGLWLLAGDLERSHSISQSLPSADGSFWHAIMHRREGDYWNSKYWYRHTKGHPVLNCLAERIGQVATESPEFHFVSSKLQQWTTPSLFAETLVDHVELSVGKHQDWQPPLQRVCWWEWQLLFQHCLTQP